MGKPVAFDHLIGYLWWLLREVDEAVRLRLAETAAVEAITRDQRFLVSRFSPASRLNPLLRNFHRLNVLSTYQALPKERGLSISNTKAA